MVSDELGLDALLSIWRQDLEVQKSAAKPKGANVATEPTGAKKETRALSETSGSWPATPFSGRDEPSAGHAARLARIAQLLTKVT